MAEPTITITPSFGRVLSFDERVTDQVINVTSTLIENTQSVVISFAGFTFTEKMNNFTASVGIGSTFFDNLIDAETYTISASVTNIFGETAEGPFDSYDFTVLPSADGSGDPVGGGSSMFVQHQDVSLGIVTTMNFAGTGLTVIVANEIAEIIVDEYDEHFDGGFFTD